MMKEMKLKGMDGVRHLLFDLGGVIMDIRRENCVAALTRLGMEGADEMLGLYCQSGPFLMLEEGKLSPADFRDEIRRRTSGVHSDAEIDDAFNEFLIGIPVERLRLLKQLRQRYSVYMLSNTNPIMFDSKIREEFQKDGGRLDDYFDGVCVSYEEHCAKPDARIFINLIEKFGIRPEETIFFDDSQANLDAAALHGFHTWLVEPGTEFCEAFEEA